MKIWNTTIGEPLPISGNNDRLHRCGLLNKILAEKGHEVVWWSSTFNHFSKKHIFDDRTTVQLKNNYILELLHGCHYGKNISFNRIKNHWQIGSQFYKSAKDYEKPDIIFTGFPSIELAYYSTKYAIKNNIPIIVDARDMWPDIFLSVVPSIAKPIAKILLWKYYSMTKFVFSNATGITGITDGFVNWGLQYANRKKTINDKSFYLGYPNEEYDPKTIEDSWTNWEKFGLEKNNFIISYVGAITGNKIDFEPILNAAKYYKDNYNVKFIIAGDGDEKDYFYDLSKQNGLSNILFLGWIDKYQIKSLLTYSSLGLVPLRNRVDYKLSIPNKPIEYISNNLPIISSLQGELKSLIEEKKIGVHYNNSTGLINGINCFINNKEELAEMAKNCSKLYLKQFNSSSVYSSFGNHIAQVFNDK